MFVKLTVAAAFLVLAVAAWPSRRVRERGRQVALGFLVLGTLGAVVLGLGQLARPELAEWSSGPAVQAWIDQQWADVQTTPPSVWWLLGLGCMLVGMLQSLSAIVPIRVAVPTANSRPLPVSTHVGTPPRNHTPVGRSELQRALDAMSQAQDEAPPAPRERRVEDLLAPR